MKLVKGYPKISNIVPKSVDFIAEIVEMEMHNGLSSDDTYAFFPAVWNDTDGADGERVSDPLTVYVQLSLADGDDDGPIYEFNLKEKLIHEAKSIYPHHGSARVSDALRVLADEVDSAIGRKD